MALTVGELNVLLRLDMRKFNTQIKAAQAIGDAFTAKFSKTINTKAMLANLSKDMRAESKIAAAILKQELGSAISITTRNASGLRAALNFNVSALGINSVTTGLNAASIAFGILSNAAGNAFNLIKKGFDEVLRSGKDFEEQMSVVASVTFSADQLNTEEGQKQFAALQQQAIELGASMIFTAQEVGQAQELLSRAGFQVDEILAATPGLLNAAAAEGMSLSEAADIASSSLRGFGMNANEMAHVADVLAMASANSNASITSLGQSFKYVSPVAKTIGLSIEEAAAALGVLADQGLKGSIAGRNLASGFMFLVTPSQKAAALLKKYNIEVYDSFGNFKNLSQILEQLSKATSGLSEKQQLANIATLVGKDNAKTYLAILNSQYKLTVNGQEITKTGIEVINEQTKALEDSAGAAEKMAKIRLDNLAGDIEMLKGDADSLAISLYNQSQPALRFFVQSANKLLVNLAPWINETFGKLIIFAQELSQAVMPDLTRAWAHFSLTAKQLGPIIGKAITYLGAFVVEGAKWGAKLVKEFALGMNKAVREVVKVLKFIGSIITAWLKPNSPPKIVPQLDQYGTDAMQLYIDAFGKADFKRVFYDVGGDVRNSLDDLTQSISSDVIKLGTAVGRAFTTGMQDWNRLDYDIYEGLTADIEDVIRGMESSGKLASDAMIPAIERSREAIKYVVDDLHNWGEASEESINAVLGSLGDVSPEVQNLVRSYANLQKASLNVARAQEELNRITEEYNSKLAPLRAEIDSINAEQQRIRDMQRIEELQKDLASGELDANETRLAELEIAEIIARQKLESAEKEQKAAEDAAQIKLDAAQSEMDAAQDNYDLSKLQIEAQQKSNDLAAEQIKLLKDLAEAQQKVADSLTTSDDTTSNLEDLLSGLTEYTSDLETIFSDTKTAIDDFKTSFDDARKDADTFFKLLSGETIFSAFNQAVTDSGKNITDLGTKIQLAFSISNKELIAGTREEFGKLIASFAILEPAGRGLAKVISEVLANFTGTTAQTLPGFVYKISGAFQVLFATLRLAIDTVGGLGVGLAKLLSGDFSGAADVMYNLKETLNADLKDLFEGSEKIRLGDQYALIDEIEQQTADLADATVPRVDTRAAIDPFTTMFLELTTKANTAQLQVNKEFDMMRDGVSTTSVETKRAVLGSYTELYDELVGNSIIPDMVTDVLFWIGTMNTGIFDTLKTIPQRLAEIATGFTTGAQILGTSLIDGIINGVTAGIQRVIEAVQSVVVNLPDPIKNLLGLNGQITLPPIKAPEIQSMPKPDNRPSSNTTNNYSYNVTGNYNQQSSQSAADEIKIISMLRGKAV